MMKYSEFEKIQFDFLGLHLMEPMAILLNCVLCLFSLFAFYQLKKEVYQKDKVNFYWSKFFLFFAVSTLLGAFGHAFFNYFSFYGKFPCWIFGSLANVFAALGMFQFKTFVKKSSISTKIVIIKSSILLLLALYFKQFLFIAVDAILTYIAYTGIFAYILYLRGARELKWFSTGVLILFPSSFIFLFKINLNRWMNKDDLSHLLMLTCIYCFYMGLIRWGVRDIKMKQVF
jgi:hypothetical protein